MVNKFIQMYKSIQRKEYFKSLGNHRQGYAFIGAGKHSIDNLYPCIHHLGIPLKFIYTEHAASAASMSALFPGCVPVDNPESILQDASVKAVFVCLPPAHHASTIKLLLQAGKHVFVEKPVGYSINELKEIIATQGDCFCQVGLQRRFAPSTRILKRLAPDAVSYNYRFLVGGYPEGNALFDIFIHPLDLVLQVFGEATIEHFSVVGKGQNKSFFITLAHGTVKGMLELSVNYTWQQPVDEITVNTGSKIISVRYPNHVSAISKTASILDVPMEKILKQPLKQSIYLDGNSFSPTGELNSLNLQGFYEEIRHFANAVEHEKGDPLCRAESLLPAYEILDLLQNRSGS